MAELASKPSEDLVRAMRAPQPFPENEVPVKKWRERKTVIPAFGNTDVTESK